MQNISKEQWKQLVNIDQSIILDVRTPKEWNEGIIPNAITLDFLNIESFKNQLTNLDINMTYFVYCRSGNRSSQACLLMDQLGYKKTYNLNGGILSWDEATIPYNS
jgi:rhodanese-related sulfurtransferase